MLAPFQHRAVRTTMDYLPLIDRTKLHFKRSDVSPIFAHPQAFATLVEDLIQPFLGEKVQYVAGLDAMGFIVGTAIALKLGVGFIPVRKSGKLAVAHDTESFQDYTQTDKALTLRLNPFPTGSRVLVVDEWIETGTQARAAIALLERAGGTIAGITAIAFRKNLKTHELWNRFKCHAVWPEAA
jgi:adenine phosphoribosyltransferase